MNPNDDTRDAALLRQVDTSIANRQSSENALLDALAGTVPQAQPQFQHALEEKLIAQLGQKNGSQNMISTTEKRKRTPRRMLRWLAAVLMLFIIGGTFISLRLAMTPMNAAPQAIEPQIGCWAQPANVSFYVVQAGDTLASIAADYEIPYEDLLRVNCLFTNPPPLIAPGTLLSIPEMGTANPEWGTAPFMPVPTIPPFELSAPTLPPQGVFRVWVAYEKIEEGTVITENMVTDTLIPIQQAVYQGQYAMPAILYGKVALIDIEPSMPILRTFVGDAPVENAPFIAAKAINFIAEGMTITADMIEPLIIPMPQSGPWQLYADYDTTLGKTAEVSIEAGDTVLFSYLEDSAWTTPAVVAREDILYGTKIESDMLIVAIYPHEVLTELEKSGYFFSTIDEAIGRYAMKTLPAWQPIQMKDTTIQAPDETGMLLLPGTVAVSLPLNLTTAIDYSLRVGDKVDVIAAMMYVDIDDTTQMPDAIAEMALDDPQLLLQHIVKNALVVYLGDMPLPTSADGTPVNAATDIVTLAVSPQDATVLTWLIDANIPMTFALSRD